MIRLIQYKLEDGNSIWIEVDQIEMEAEQGEGFKQAARDLTKEIKFEEAIDKVVPAANIIVNKLRNLTTSPNKIEIGFGIKMNTQVGAVIASAGLEANYTITLTWEKEK